MPKRDKDMEETAATAATGTTTIEADSVEEAMQRVAAEHGSGAEIVDARKVNRGGIGGFFAKERVQLTVKTPQDETAPAADTAGLAQVLDRMTRDAEAQETEFATMLRNELGEDTRDLGLDTFLEAVGWDAKKSAAAAEETLIAAGDVAASTTQAPATPAAPATPVQSPTQAITAPQSAMAQAVAGTAAAELAARAITGKPPQHVSTPPPIVVQHPGLIAPTPPQPTRSPLEDVFDAGAVTPEMLRQAAREGVISATPEPAQLAAAGAAAEMKTEHDQLPAWRITPLDTDPAGMGAVAWSTMELVRCGVPTEIVSAVAELNPTDDLAWITGLAAAVAPYCESLQGIDTILVGARATELAEALELEIIQPGQTAPYAGSFASPVTTDQDDRDWLQFVKGKRRLHYVIDSDRAWRDNMLEAPAVISWTDEASLVDALYLAVAFNARLGFGVTPESAGRFTKIYPVDVALAIRSMMGRS